MFTGIIESTGVVISLESRTLEIATAIDGLNVGDSISINGVCLTVTSASPGRFTVELSEETLLRTNMSDLTQSQKVNLEKPLAADGHFGGHFVQGHVDGTARVERIEKKAGSVEMWLASDNGLEKYMVEKGSVSLDGVSLTIMALDGGRFAVSLIPHTLATTTLAEREIGDILNLEVDVLAKYVERLLPQDRRNSDE